MTKYFTLESVSSALESMQGTDGKWALVSLVLAINGVTTKEVVDISARKGSDRALDSFVSGTQIGLEPRQPGGKVNLRPKFKDLSTSDNHDARVNVDYSKLWSSTLSQSGYAKMRDSGNLAPTTGSKFRLGPDFSVRLVDKLGPAFRFENFLIWLFAFRGIPDDVESWLSLREYFESEFSEEGIPADYDPGFSLTGDVPWPTDFLNTRPTNDDYQKALTPGLASVVIRPNEWANLQVALSAVVGEAFDGYSTQRIDELTRSIVAGLSGSKRIFLYGDPGTGKSQLARMIISAFEQQFGDRIHAVFTPIADSSSADKLLGFSTLDGRWIDGELTREGGGATKTKLLYPESEATKHRRQINVLVLDEANRRDIEELLAKLQLALDSHETSPDSAAYRIGLDNSGEQIIAPNTFLVMTGNSPRDDSGRQSQSRPFKRRQNLVVVENAFSPALESTETLTDALRSMWVRVSRSNFPEDFGNQLFLDENEEYRAGIREILAVLDEQSIGISYGLIEKILRTAAARYSLSDTFSGSLDFGFTESVLPLLATDSTSRAESSLQSLLLQIEPANAKQFPRFFSQVRSILRPPDELGRVRAFL